MTEFSNPPLRIGDELVYYYGSSSWGKSQPRPYRVSGGGVFRGRLRPDGFVSVDRGSLTTRKLRLAGTNLSVNGIGPIRIDVVASTDLQAPALATASIEGDSLRHRVTFDGRRSLRDVAPEGIVQLRFHVSPGGALYSFTIDEGQVAGRTN